MDLNLNSSMIPSDIPEIVRADKVNKFFGTMHILKDIDMVVHKKEVVVIIGPSGAGKSTLLRCINHLEKINSGHIFVNGKMIGYHEVKGRLVEDSEKNIAVQRAEIGMVFQRFNLFPHLTALENIIEAPVNVRKMAREQAEAEGEQLLARVGLSDKRDKYPNQLSGGQQQRIAIARALLMDPNNYAAALFIGDVYFKQHTYGSAGEWFARAIQIDPNRETAYRYWCDALVAMGKEDEARSKFIDGIVADPYTRRSWTGLQNWLQRNKVELNNVKLKDRSSVTVKDGKNINLTLDSSLAKDDPDAQAWMSYGLDRAAWHTEESEKESPKIPRDRRTLQEEAHALNFMITVLKEQKDYEKRLAKLDPSLQALIKIQKAGFLDPFVLLNRADAGIAQDYPAYRAANRDKIRSYLDDFMVPKTPSPAK